MTYFHTGTRTIIGAKSFHCPVRDGKEWYQLAMVTRHNLCAKQLKATSQIHRVKIRFFFYLIAQLGITSPFEPQISSIKVIGSSRSGN